MKFSKSELTDVMALASWARSPPKIILIFSALLQNL